MFKYVGFQKGMSKRQRNLAPRANKITAFLSLFFFFFGQITAFLLRLIHKSYPHNLFFNGR